MWTPSSKCSPSTSQEPVAQADLSLQPSPPCLPSPSLDAQGGVSARTGWEGVSPHSCCIVTSHGKEHRKKAT